MSGTVGFVREDGKPAAYSLTGQETGRPTGYHPDYCNRVIALGAEGKSKVEIASDLGVVVKTLDNWAAAHPEFLQAITRAKQEEQVWWERIGRQHLTAQTFQASMWSRSMAARFPNDWREKSDSNVNMSGSLQVTEIKRTIVDPDNPDA